MPWWVGVSILLLFVVFAVRTIRRRANARAIDQLLLQQATRDLDDWESRIQVARRLVSNLTEEVVRFGWDSQGVQIQSWSTQSNEILVNAHRNLAPIDAWQDGRLFLLLDGEITSVRRLIWLLIRRDWDTWTKEASGWYQYKTTVSDIGTRVADRRLLQESFKVKSARVESALGLAACIALLISLLWAIDGTVSNPSSDIEPDTVAAAPNKVVTPKPISKTRSVPTKTVPPTRVPTELVFTSAYPTATQSDPDTEEFWDWGTDNCPNYNPFMSDFNDRNYRAWLLVDLLDQALAKDNKFSKLNVPTMIVEIDQIISEERDSGPPSRLQDMSDEQVKVFRLIRAVLMEAEQDTVNGYNQAIDELNGFVTTGLIDPFEACGYD